MRAIIVGQGALRQSPRTPPCPTERALIRQAQEGDGAAMAALVQRHMGFIGAVAARYRTCVEWEDLLSAGKAGLVEAVVRFDLTKPNRFLTYAVHWIRQHMSQLVCDMAYPVTMPSSVMCRLVAARHQPGAETDLDGALGDLGASLDERRALRYATAPGLALDGPAFSAEEDRGTAVGERFDEADVVTRDPGADAWVPLLDDPELLEEALGTLDGRTRQMVCRRFGMAGEEPALLESIGRTYGITRERARQVINQGLRHLRSYLLAHADPAFVAEAHRVRTEAQARALLSVSREAAG